MAFELKSDDSVRKNLRRIARKQMEKALELLGGRAAPSRDTAVHEARKCFKKLRALLRLARPHVIDAVYRRENLRFRDAARPLSELRDARILIESLDKLIEHFAEHVSGRSFTDVRKELETNRQAVRKRVFDEQDSMAAAADGIRAGQKRLDDWTDVPNRWSSVGDGLDQIYERALDGYTEVKANPTDANLHEWRKQAKYLRYNLEILKPSWPGVMGDLAGEVDHLGELLGDDHDLVVLKQTLTQKPGQFGPDAAIETLVALSDRRRAELQFEANVLGQRLFQDRPRDLGRRLKGYWKAWREESARALSQV